MKRVISVCLAAIAIMLAASPLAYAADLGPKYTFICADNSVIEYYLDENEMPFYYQAGEKIYLLIPIESCIITDETKLAQLNASLNQVRAEETTAITRSAPTSYYSLMQRNVSLDSNIYSQYMTMENGGNKTAILKKHTSHSFIRVKTADLGKPNALSSKKVNITVQAYLESFDQWIETTLTGVDATGSLGKGINLTSGVNYCYVYMDKYLNAVWFTLNVWTSPYEG